MKISVIIPTFQREVIMLQTVHAAVKAIEGLDAEVIVINDGPEYSAQLPASARFYKNPKKGVSSARNFGFSKSTGDILFFVDNDILLTPEVFHHFQQLIKKHPKALFNPNWEYPVELKEEMQTKQFGRFLLKTGNFNYQAWAKKVAWGTGPLVNANELATFCLIMRREVFEQIGAFDEGIHFGEEDLELTRRAKKLGFDLIVDESIFVYHNEADRVSLSNKLNRMKIVGSMLRQDPTFNYGRFKRMILQIQSKIDFILFWGIKMIPNTTFFDSIYALFAHRLIADAIFKGYCNGNHHESIAHTYSKIK